MLGCNQECRTGAGTFCSKSVIETFCLVPESEPEASKTGRIQLQMRCKEIKQLDWPVKTELSDPEAGHQSRYILPGVRAAGTFYAGPESEPAP